MTEVSKSLRERILAKRKMRGEWLEIPEWEGEKVFVREMTGAERDRYEGDRLQVVGKSIKFNTLNAKAKLAVMVCMDGPDGAALFQSGDIEQLSLTSAAALDRIYDVAAKLSRLGDQQEKDAEKT